MHAKYQSFALTGCTLPLFLVYPGPVTLVISVVQALLYRSDVFS